MSTGKPRLMSRKCNHCYITGDEKKLFTCSRCRSQTYCSKECQKADWKVCTRHRTKPVPDRALTSVVPDAIPQNHKAICQNNGMLESMLKEHEHTVFGQFERATLVDGITRYELDQRLEKWVRFHNPTLMAATIQALRLPADISRARTHLLYVTLLPRGQAEHGGAAGKFFRVESVEVITVEDGLGRGSPWPESIVQLQQMAEEMERQGQGTVAAAMIECPPLAVQTVPFGSMTERALRREVLHDTWRAWFVNQIEQGLRPKLVKTRR